MRGGRSLLQECVRIIIDALENLIVRLRGCCTILIVTHNLAQARRISGYAVLFWAQNGASQLSETDPSKQIFEEPRDPLTAAYVSGMRG